MRTVLHLALAALLLAACVDTPKPSSAATATTAATAPQSREACEQAGGRWARGGLAGREQCFQRYPDAGKACAKADDCQGRCIVQADGAGQCQTERPRYGCFSFLDREGKKIGVCVD